MRRGLSAVAIGLGLLLAAAGALIVFSTPAPRAPLISTLPSASPVAIIDRLPAPSDAPVPVNPSGTAATRVRLPELGIDLAVVPGDGVNAPLYRAAEYPSPMKQPGQGGRSMIYAHARPGMFGPLLNGKVGQHVDVTLADGRQLHYVVRQYYSHWPVTDLSWFSQAGHEQLILVTCTTYDPNDPRIVAVAEPA